MDTARVNVATLLADLLSRGVEFRVEGDRIVYRPAAAVSAEIRETLADYKAEVLRLLSEQPATGRSILSRERPASYRAVASDPMVGRIFAKWPRLADVRPDLCQRIRTRDDLLLQLEGAGRVETPLYARVLADLIEDLEAADDAVIGAEDGGAPWRA